MAVLTAQHLEHLRNNLLRVLGEHWHLTFAYAEAQKYLSGPVMVIIQRSHGLLQLDSKCKMYCHMSCVC
jgi:hypothetical protein